MHNHSSMDLFILDIMGQIKVSWLEGWFHFRGWSSINVIHKLVHIQVSVIERCLHFRRGVPLCHSKMIYFHIIMGRVGCTWRKESVYSTIVYTHPLNFFILACTSCAWDDICWKRVTFNSIAATDKAYWVRIIPSLNIKVSWFYIPVIRPSKWHTL